MGGEGVHNPADLGATNTAIAALAVTQAVILAVVQDTNADLDLVATDVTDIMTVTDGLPTLTNAVGIATTTVINTEYNLYVLAAPLGVYRPILVTVNFLNQAAGETVILRTYRRDTDGGVWSLVDETLPIVGVQDPVLLKIVLDPNRYGMRTTIERTAGAIRDYPWSAFYEI